ncbi:MAG: hypothetical protein BWK74_00990 [Desulfobacteraceae bacterium A6]|nr:MAG: hypothetical protein BWK74_00990 [Desulfobacteraceae bacterium A6]
MIYLFYKKSVLFEPKERAKYSPKVPPFSMVGGLAAGLANKLNRHYSLWSKILSSLLRGASIIPMDLAGRAILAGQIGPEGQFEPT